MAETTHYEVSPIDENHLLYGNFIGLQYVFKDGLDAAVLENAVAVLINQLPILAGHYRYKTATVLSRGKKVALERLHSNSSLSETLTSFQRPKHISEPLRKDVLRGKAPLSTFTLTTFDDGGAILGVAISHLLSDAAGYHKILGHLADIYSALLLGQSPPEFPLTTYVAAFLYGTDRSKSQCLSQLKKRGLPKPIPIEGLIGRFTKPLIIKAMDKSLTQNPPIKIQFSADNVTRLKETVLSESGEKWISTNMALCAHFISIIAKLSYGDDIRTEMQIGQLLDLRNRYFERQAEAQSQYVGNAILIHIDNAAFPDGLQKTSRGVLARYFKQRQNETNAADVNDRLHLLADCLAHGYTNPELDVKSPIISLNNQSKMPVYDIRFGDQKALRIYPQDVGDNIMFFPAPDGGIEIYIRDIVNPGGQQKLLTPDWQKQIFDF